MLAGAQNNQFQMSLGEAMGSGLFIITIVLASVGLLKPFTLEPLALCMDALVYLCTVVYLLIITLNSEVVWAEMSLFPVIYFGYVAAVVVVDYIRRRRARLQKLAASINSDADDEAVAPPTSSVPYVPFINPATPPPPPASTPPPPPKAASPATPAAPSAASTAPSASVSATAPAPAPAQPVNGIATAPAAAALADDGDAEQGGASYAAQAQSGADDGDGDGDGKKATQAQGVRAWAAQKWGDFKEWAEWSEKGHFGRFRFLIELPVTLMRMLTIPSVARASYTRLALNCLWSPVFCVWAIGMYDKTLGPTFPVWGLALIVGATALPLMLFFNKPRVFPHVHLVFTFWNFIVSIVWLNTLANELVTLLQSLGVLFAISGAIIGATVLAAGNSIGDLVADVAVAREGQPRAAVAACYASPLLNALLGLGVTLIYALIKAPAGYQFEANKSIWFVFAFLIAVLVLTLVVFPAYRMRMTRLFSVVLFTIYAIFLVIIVLVEAKILAN